MYQKILLKKDWKLKLRVNIEKKKTLTDTLHFLFTFMYIVVVGDNTYNKVII